MKIFALISRFLIGALFVFSGFVKAVDPWGSQFKFEDYFIAFGMDFMIPFALILGILLSTAEFLIGVAMIFGIKPKLSAWSALLFMALFTPLTMYLAITDDVSDCGCFGDALVLTNWETFYKNLVILVFVVIVFLYRKKFKHWMSCKLEWIPVIVFTLGILWVSIHGLRHLPLIDFRPWKLGNSMLKDPSVKDKYFVIYKDKQTGQTKEYPADDFPWEDSVWVANNEFVDQRIEAAPRPNNMILIMDADGNDLSDSITQNAGFQFMLISYYVEVADKSKFKDIATLAIKAQENGVGFVGITGSTPAETEVFRHELQLAFPFYYADEITLKTVIRSNPGLVLLKNGTVIGLWAWRDIPTYEEIDFTELESKYLKK